jgi:uncharacterized protein (DUF58 family)
MKLGTLRQIFSLRDLSNAAVGIVVIAGGIGLALLTLYAHRTDQPRLAGIAAGLSLLSVLLIIIFVVPPLARNASKEASQMNLPFEFTLGGAIMLGLIVIVGFSAWNTGNNLLFLVLSFLTAAMICGFLAGNFTLKKLDVKMRFPETIFAGEPTPIYVSLKNRKRFFPSYSVVAEVRGSQREESIAAPDLRRLLPRVIADRLARAPIVRRTLDYFVRVPRNETAESKTEHVFSERGRLMIKDFELSTRFPFAFFRHRRRLSAKETELVVFPKPEPLDAELENEPLDIGELTAFKRGTGQDLLALRDYHPNDDLRRVDWKATARSRNLIVREFSAEDDKRIILFLDPVLPGSDEKTMTVREKIEAEQDGSGNLRSERFEHAVGTAASLLSHFTEEQAAITVLIGGNNRDNSGDGGIGSRHLHESFKRLAVVEAEYRDDGAADRWKDLIRCLDEGGTTHVLVLTTAPDSSIPDEVLERARIIRF